MAEMYFNLVINHRRTCNLENKQVKQVPTLWREEVISLLSERGYDHDGKKLD